jgi:phosphate starvation-inducible PhoH-like protein
VTPAVESGENIGFLSGSMEEKLQPYLFSTYYLIDKIIGKNNRKKLQEEKIIEPLGLGFIRGISVDSAILICEETQNTTTGQMKTLLTRIGFNSKFIISGDLEQTDRPGNTNGLNDAVYRTKNINDIGLVEFTVDDMVRNKLITQILKNYED